ncbi:uncharacterized protein PV09_08755 [Verruconis gallopava]|uniref:Alkaline ceramidase 3 n=1 Tax=Verruconis gallopava TaxID=253628 RepID=A0A0D2AKP8_9PEZI|nr:uncharacterized protein PV09_08755 [Verruconis gallopava]KIV99578.1 hypothetical protein PV09_08755 [Verruconis gallopava]
MWSIQYGPPKPKPFWGKQTSAVNFCEEDYIITRYVGEFINTLTSLFYVLYGYHGIRRCRRQNLGLFSPVNWTYWALVGVGLFSALYHASLKYHTQMGDEMSMHLATGTVFIQVFTFRKPAHEQRRNIVLIVVGLTAFVVYHCVTDEFVMHVVVFFGTSVTVSLKTSRIIKETIRDRAVRKRLHRLTTFATCNALIAWLIWNVDVHFCATLTRWKHALGMPWGILLELHGYWHLLTAISAYCFMAEIEFLTTSADGAASSFAWPAKLALGGLGEAKDSGGRNGKVGANGAATKED